MPWRDMRSFPSMLEERGDLIRIAEELDWEYEAVSLTRETSDADVPALLFERIKDSDIPCISGLFAAKRRVAWSLEMNEDDLFDNYREREGRSIPAELVDDAPCQEIVITGDDVDLTKLPILRHYERDAGRYITAGRQLAQDPESGIRNVSINRMLLLGRNRLSVYAPMGRHLRYIIERHAERGGTAEIATVFGAEPATQLGSQARANYGADEFDIAGGMRGAPVELVPCRTIDVAVPATAEMIIEGRIVQPTDPADGLIEMVDDGPFGEYPGTYSDASPEPVLEVTAITMRRGGMYQNTLTGMPMTENHWMMQAGGRIAGVSRSFQGRSGGQGGERHPWWDRPTPCRGLDQEAAPLRRPQHDDGPARGTFGCQAGDRGGRRHRRVRPAACGMGGQHPGPGRPGRGDRAPYVQPDPGSVGPKPPEQCQVGIDATINHSDRQQFLPPRIMKHPDHDLAHHLAQLGWSCPDGHFD